VSSELFMVHIYTGLKMEEQEFRTLLDKYLNGSITNSEKNVLERFENELEFQNSEPAFFSEKHKNEIKIALWKNIQKGAAKEKLIKMIRWSAAAAVFIIFISIGHIYLNSSSSKTSRIIPENAVTLQLEDGTIRIVNNNGQGNILDGQGKVVGQQEGASIKYSATQIKKKLVHNSLTVPYGKTFVLQLSDGTTAHLNAGSSMRYPVQFIEGLNREVFITGEAYLKVVKDTKHPFIVNTGDLNVRVLGTQFNVSSYPEDDLSEVVLVEGSVSLYTDSVGYNVESHTLLEPNFKGSFNKSSNKIDTSKVITSIYTSWVSGKLVFRNITFKKLLKKLERHYDVSIINNNNTLLMDERFNANFGDEPIEKVLEELKTNYKIKYNYSDDKIIIH